MFCDEQGGFRPRRGTPDQILIFRETLASRRERGLPTYTTFIDVKKAYATVWREQAYVLGLSDPFPVDRGVAQGAVEFPWVYAAFIDGISQALHQAGLGIWVAGTRVPVFKYADDMILLANSPSDQNEQGRDRLREKEPF